MPPLVSIIIPAYNKADLTIKTVESVLAQDYPALEIIVVDDGSTDSTELKIKDLKGNIIYIRKQNGGACSARNLGIQASSGEYIAFLDCDDLYLPSKISRSIMFFESHPDVGMVHTAAYFINETDAIVGIYDHRRSRRSGRTARLLSRGNFICNSTIVVKKQVLSDCGCFDENIFSPADWDLWLRIAERHEIGYIREPLTKYRVSGNYILRHLEKSKKEERYVLEKYLARNPSLGIIEERRLVSDFHLRYAQCYFIHNRQEFRREFLLSLRKNPLNPKGLSFLLGLIFAPAKLSAVLKRKIVRYAE